MLAVYRFVLIGAAHVRSYARFERGRILQPRQRSRRDGLILPLPASVLWTGRIRTAQYGVNLGIACWQRLIQTGVEKRQGWTLVPSRELAPLFQRQRVVCT